MKTDKGLAPTAPTITDIVWAEALSTWTGHLHSADPENFAHIEADTEYLPPSPLATQLRAEVYAELTARTVTA